ncbi:MAG: helix-turn-helix domain-containing protein [Lentisphaerae bacterium]|nr:helix-turn-helix domain-containing protein [Lentisphaerota bacterium]
MSFFTRYFCCISQRLYVRIYGMKTRLIIASVKFDSISGRDILSGLFAYNEPGYRWRYRIIQTEEEFSTETIQGLFDEGADGFVLTFQGNAECMRILSESGKPIVSLGARSAILNLNRQSVAYVKNDNKAIGRMGGEYLTSLGRFASFGFIHSKPGFHFSEERVAAFKSYLKKRNQEHCHESMPLSPEGSEADISALAEWIASLPKPAAVMAACDRRAMHAIAAAKRAGVKIPDQMSLLGVDNDELLAENSEPPLSSILPGHFEMGLSAARELVRILSSKKSSGHKTVLTPPNKVVERESTAPLTPALTLVLRAKAFITARSAKGLTVQEVVRHLGCSRNLLDLRFKEIEGITVHAAIENTRMKSVMHLVETTNRPVAAIASQCGFKSPNRLTHLFKQRFGKSIRDWRTSGRSACGHKSTEMKVPVCAAHSIAGGDSSHGAPLRKSEGKKSPRERKCRKRQ